MTANEWIKAINEAETNEEVVKLWQKMWNRIPNGADEVTLEVHKACVDTVLNALGYPRKDNESG